MVAGEVRTLAQHSANAAKKMKELIENALTGITGGPERINQAGRTMSEIAQSIQRVSTIMGEVALASREQSDGIEQVNRAASQMDEMTQQNATLVEETAAAALPLADQRRALRSTACRFRT